MRFVTLVLATLVLTAGGIADAQQIGGTVFVAPPAVTPPDVAPTPVTQPPAAQPTAAQPAANPARGMGVLADDPSDLAAATEADPPARGVTPASVDLTSSFPAPGSQGSMGTCVGWALANLASFHENEEQHRAGSGEGPAFSPLFLYNLSKSPSDGDCTAGLSIAHALNVLRDNGIAPIASFPYRTDLCGSMPGADVQRAAMRHRISTWAKVHEHDASELKSFLAARHPVILSVRVDDALQNLHGQKYAQRGGDARGDHALLLVGYDDTKHAWKVLNSWGSEWGERGYGWIDYDVWNDLVRAAYVAEDRVEAPPPATENSEVTPVEPTVDPNHIVDRSTLDDDLRFGLTIDQFSSGLHEYGRGVEVSVFDPYVDSLGQVRINACWHRGAEGLGWSWNYRAEDLNALYQRQQREGSRFGRMWVTEGADGTRFLMSWRRDGRDRTWSVNYGSDTFPAQYTAMVNRGWQIRHLLGTVHGGTSLLHASWEDGRNQPATIPNWFDRADTFARNVGQRREEGYQLVEIAPVNDGTRVYFHSIFRQQTEPTTWSIFDTSSSMSQTGDHFASLGFSPTMIEVTVSNGAPAFHSVWTRRRGCTWAWNHTAQSLPAQHTAHVREGRQLNWLRSYAIGQQRYFTAVWCSTTP